MTLRNCCWNMAPNKNKRVVETVLFICSSCRPVVDYNQIQEYCQYVGVSSNAIEKSTTSSIPYADLVLMKTNLRSLIYGPLSITCPLTEPWITRASLPIN
jgi:hypothetical protein